MKNLPTILSEAGVLAPDIQDFFDGLNADFSAQMTSREAAFAQQLEAITARVKQDAADARRVAEMRLMESKKESDALRADLDQSEQARIVMGQNYEQELHDLRALNARQLESANAERDAALNQLDAFFAKQVGDVKAGKSAFQKIAEGFSELQSVAENLVTPIDERIAAEEAARVAALIAAKEKELAELRS